MTTLQDIVSKAPIAPAFSEDAKWATGRMFEALQLQVLDQHGSLDQELLDSLAAFYANELTLHTVYDIAHDSDEACSCEVLCYRSQPVLMQRCIGDRMDYSEGLEILDADFAKQLVLRFSEYQLEQQLAGMEVSIPSDASILWADNQYLTPVAPEAFVVNSPKWALGFEHAFQQFSAYALDEQGRMQRLLEFVRWENRHPSWSNAEDVHKAWVRTERGEESVDARQVVFLLPGADASLVDDLAREAQKDSAWRLLPDVAMPRNVTFVRVLQHVQGRLVDEMCSVAFGPSDSYVQAYAFLKKYPEPVSGNFRDMSSALLAEYPTAKLV